MDEETGEEVEAINDRLLEDMEALQKGELTDTLRFVDAREVSMRTAVPTYYDRRYHDVFTETLTEERFAGFTSATIGDLIKDGRLEVRNGHGSPSQSVRVGTVPYIKVSDLRAGLVNINPTNRVPAAIAQGFWRGTSSGLRPWDLICPERTSKNIGDFCLLLPGQEDVVVTKEVIVLRPGPKADFDAFYLLWAMTLTIVRDQWRRVIFMQTNREDVGGRYLEIEIPIAPTAERANEVSAAFRAYYTSLAEAREGLRDFLTAEPHHHFFIGSAHDPVADEDEDDVEAGVEAVAEEQATTEP
ncbi:hypothetical protein [Modestobacter sp. NPDC049651]|uniref:hypothetical protein n=1 Tax=unclassified Modestobacter TaxID=2643866 RepID=UPI0033CC0A54